MSVQLETRRDHAMIRYRVADVYVCKQICTVCRIKINNTAAGSVP